MRLRENKRRSRARQKEYLQQLERRCRDYEQSDVQATVEMQVAARKVAEENRLLRSLLKKMGAEDAMVNNWLESQGNAEERLATSLPLRSRSRSANQDINGDPLPEGLSQDHEQSFSSDVTGSFAPGTLDSRNSAADSSTVSQ